MDGIDRIGRRQHGLVTTAQLTTAGWSRTRIDHDRRRGRLVDVRRGVWRVAGAPITQPQAWLAAALAAGPGAVLSHGTAWRAFGFGPGPVDEGGIDVLVAAPRKHPRLDGVVGHRTNHLPSHHRTRRDGLPVTSAERTLVDSCGVVTARQLAGAVGDGRRRRLVRLPRLASVVDEVPASGRRAIRPMVELLETLIAGYEPGGSEPEVDLVRLLVRAGFERPAQQVRVVHGGRTMFVDVGWLELRVGFEYDSVEFHQHRFHEDRDRLRRLKLAGWDVWPITKTTSRNEILAIATLAWTQKRIA
jgi:hypothetical protein